MMKKTLFPLNHAQQRIYLVECMNPGTAMWNVPRTVQLEQLYSYEVIKSSLKYILKHEKTLSLRIAIENGTPVLFFSDEQIAIEFLKFRHEGGESAYQEWVKKESNKPFEMINGGPLCRVYIAETGPLEHSIFINTHHIIFDGSSFLLLTSRLSKTLQAIASGKPLPVFPSHNFLDFVSHEEKYLNSPEYEKDKTFWLEKTQNIPELVDLAFRHSENIDRKRLVFQISPELADIVYSYGEKERVSPFRILLSAFSIYCSRITGNEEMIIGTAFANRYPEEMLDVLGMFVASVPLFISCKSEQNFSEVLQSVTDTLKSSQIHSRFPYEQLIAEKRRQTGESVNLIDYTFVQDIPEETSTNLHTIFHNPEESANTLTIFCRAGRKGDNIPIILNVLYNPVIFSQKQIERMIGHIEAIAREGCTGVPKKISEIRFLSPGEEFELLSEFNSTYHSYPETTLHQLIHERAIRQPDNIALVYQNTRFSYSEVDKMSSILAEKLVQHGAGRDVFIAILADRSPFLIIAQLAILKSGAVILPIDPNYPAERIRYILKDSSCPIILSNPRFISFIKENSINVSFVIDLTLKETFSGQYTRDTARGSPSDLAIILYTSGSTGNPKGVQLEHRSIVNFCHWFIEYTEITDADHVAKHASFSFDSSIPEIFPTLIMGATLFLIDDDIRLSLKHLNEYYEENKISIGVFTTQFCEQFMEFADNNSLRVLHTGGEKLRFYKKRKYSLVNGYGPTECTVLVAALKVETESENIPIGYPIHNCRIYILDRWNNLQPVGAAGELCIAGTCLARGYLNLAEKTNQAFTDNPVVPGERLYRTGDLACWTQDGSLLYMGRMDRQVKIRGFRIEIGEVEKVLLLVPGISEAAVIDIKDELGRVTLCGYYTSGAPLENKIITDFLKTRLPEFMIPGQFIKLENLPINPNGKIDRKKLPHPDITRVRGEYLPPISVEEKQIVNAFEEVLLIKPVGVEDDFFSIGGDSIKAALLIAKLERLFSCDIPLRDFFRLKTPRGLALILAKTEHPVFPPIVPAKQADVYPVTESQKQLFMLEKIPTIGTTYNIPIVIDIQGQLDKKRLAKSIISLIERHEALRTRFAIDNGEPVQVIDSEGKIRLTYEEVSPSETENAIKSFFSKFDLSKSPLFKAKLLQLAPEQAILLLDIHHIISDGISISIILKDLSLLYAGTELKPPSFQFKDYTTWVKGLEHEGLLEKNVSFWVNYLDEYQPGEFITDNPRSSTPDFIGSSREFVLDSDLTQSLRELVNKSSTTLHSALTGIISLLYSKYTQKDDVVVGTTTNGRGPEGSESVVGMFVETIPVRSRFSPDKTFFSYLQHLRDDLFDLYDHEPFPSASVYSKVTENRGVGRHPLIDLNIIVQNMEMETFNVPGLTTKRRLYDLQRVKFDISITIREEQNNLIIRIDYRSSLFRDETIRLLEIHLLSLLRSITEDPHKKIIEYTIIDDEERNFLLNTINDTNTPRPAYRTIASAISAICQAYPEYQAVIAEDGSISYRELERISAQIAGEIQDKIRNISDKTDLIVAIIAERSYLTIAAMVGALRAGVAYVAIDPLYPEERIKFILGDTGATILIGKEAALQTKKDLYYGCYISIDRLSQETANLKRISTWVTPFPNDLAYIVYTSGSTGTPKGVMIEHHSMVNFISWYTKQHQIGSDSNCAEFASFTFDVSVVQIFAPLITGAELHIIPDTLRFSPQELDLYFEEQNITHAHFPTQFAEQFIEVSKNRKLKRLVVGGDRLKKYKIGNYQLVNEYGPSETTMASTSIEISSVITNPSIGRPIANTRIYVLDGKMNLVPLGIPGELYIAGEGVARGYRNRPELTEEKFLNDPFVPGGRMYRTGDRVRIHSDGCLEFIGRIDFQVKIRGYRIEPGEIESALRDINGVKNAVVLAWDDSGGGKYLCGYYEADEPIRESDLRSYLHTRIPEYMVPARFVHIPEFPLNRNGKIDRHAFEMPDPTHISCHGKQEPPRNKTEQLIAKLWVKVLKEPFVSIFDDFFELGADSLRAISLLVELEKYFEVTISDIFEYRTIADQAIHLKPSKTKFNERIKLLKDLVISPEADFEVSREKEEYYKISKNTKWESFNYTARRNYRTVLLTGVTGTLGGYLLRDLLTTTDYSVILIVRASDDPDAIKRVRKRMVATFGEEFLLNFVNRVTVYAGDLTKESLGISKEIYEKLVCSVDAVIHSAALTKHIGDYQDFYEANVTSTSQLLKFCKLQKIKDFNYISTISVGSGIVSDRDSIFFSEFTFDVGQEITNPYVLSKFEAEKLVHAARDDGVNTTVFRAGNITFDSQTGDFQHNVEDNAFFQQVRAYINLGLVPVQYDERNFSFVNETSKNLISLFNRKILDNPLFHTIHLVNPNVAHLSDLLSDPALGIRLRRSSFSEFIDIIAELYGFYGFSEYIDRLFLHLGWSDLLQEVRSTSFIVSSDISSELLSNCDLSWSVPKPAMMNKFVTKAMTERIRFLASIPSFSTISENYLLNLARLVVPVAVKSGDTIQKENNPVQELTLHVNGFAEMYKHSIDGWTGTIRILGPGDISGEECITTSDAYTTVEAFEDLYLYTINSRDLTTFIKEDPDIALAFIRILSEKIKRLDSILIEMGTQ